MRVLITGGAGFIGSAAVRHFVADGHEVLNFDKLTYAGDLRTVRECEGEANYRFVQADIVDREAVSRTFVDFAPDCIMHLAAESHVDRSIDAPETFIQTNLVGTSVMLDGALEYWRSRDAAFQEKFRFLQVSTDEVYGSLDDQGSFHEATPYAPNSPYSASKAGADHLARAWHRTYGLPVIIANCSNNYGPFQNPEKLIPTVIRAATRGELIPVYGKGENIRDWLYVDDHIRALEAISSHGKPGEKYNVGGDNELRNIDLVRLLCELLDEETPRSDGKPYSDQIAFVTDRPGHDFRYAIAADKLKGETGWAPIESRESGLRKTVQWFLRNREWLDGTGETAPRLGLGRAG